eukprot:scaffold151055_cov44-Attheya_sp.AAC.2
MKRSAYVWISCVVLFATRAEALSTPSSPSGQTAKNVATQILQGAGAAEVDLNQYNLDSLEQIEAEWKANLVQKVTEKEVRPNLDVQSERTLFADRVQVTFPRKKESGLGIQLVEIAGGRDDGLGITLVSGLVKGGSADGMDILPGDSITNVAILRQRRNSGDDDDGPPGLLSEVQEEFKVNTECLSYDGTVNAILSLPPPTSSSSNYIDEFYCVTLKRIRRKPKIIVNLRYPPSQGEPDETLELFAGENLRQGMLLRGVKLNDPLAKRFDSKTGGNCGAGGLCRTCAVTITKGAELLNPQRAAEKQMLEDTPRWRLACKAIVGYGMREGDMTINVNPRSWAE